MSSINFGDVYHSFARHSKEAASKLVDDILRTVKVRGKNLTRSDIAYAMNQVPITEETVRNIHKDIYAESITKPQRDLIFRINDAAELNQLTFAYKQLVDSNDDNFTIAALMRVGGDRPLVYSMDYNVADQTLVLMTNNDFKPEGFNIPVEFLNDEAQVKLDGLIKFAENEVSGKQQHAPNASILTIFRKPVASRHRIELARSAA